MPTLDVIDRLKQATTDHVPAPLRSSTGLDTTRTPTTGCCDNCGRDALTVSIEHRHLVPTEEKDDGNYVALCEECHDAAPTAAAPMLADGAGGVSTYDTCKRSHPVIDSTLVRERDEHRCRGCGVRERIVVGDGLHVHPVVPTSSAGHRHPHNYVSLCPTCHRKLHE